MHLSIDIGRGMSDIYISALTKKMLSLKSNYLLMVINYKCIKEAYKNKGYTFFESGSYNINLFGIRSNNSIANEFNDFMGIAYQDDLANSIFLLFKATTDPGLYWLKTRKGNINGTAILVPGRYPKCWKLGYHKGYQAMQQNGAGVFRVWRDNNSNGELDKTGHIYTDVHGLNGHTTSFKNDVEKVGMYSAGCQVIQDDLDFKIYLSIIIKSANKYGDIFSYTLFEEDDF